MRIVYLFVFSLVFLQVDSSSNLLTTQPLYGIAALTRDNNNTTCQRQLHILKTSIDDRKVWAIKAMDASGRPESGFIYGNNLWIGSHTQCDDISNMKPLEINNEKIKNPETPYDYPPYPLGFAMVNLKHNSTLQRHTQLPLEWTTQVGLCLPISCTKDEIFDLAESYFNSSYLDLQQLLNISMEVVEVRKLASNNLWILKLPKTIILIIILITIIILTIMGTIYDIRRHNLEKNIMSGHNAACSNGKTVSISTVELVTNNTAEEPPQRNIFFEVLQCFSFYSNVKSLFKTKIGSDSIGCIHGFRFLSMLWVIAVHSIFYQIDYLKNVPYGYRVSESLASQTFSNSTYAVDSYLFLSGFLVAYLYYKTHDPHKKSENSVNYLLKVREFIMTWINRFCRLTPQYMVVLLFTDVIYTYYRENSSLTSSERPDTLCDKYWWRNLLYINNLFPRSEMCLSWSWYLSLDTQCFTVTLFLLILSTIVFKVAAASVFIMIILAIIVTAWKSYTIGYVPTMDEQLAQLDAIYDLPWNRIGPYLVGVITAYVLKVKLQNKLPLTKRVRRLLWTIFPLVNLWIVFTLYTRNLSVEFSAVYMGISRTLWGVGLAWVLIACCTGNARPVEKLLSFKGFVPLSRLTYCAYLLNPVVATMFYLGSESAYEASLAEFAFTVGGVTLTTFYMSYLFSVLVESPFILLTKMALRKSSRTHSNPKQTTT